MVCLGLEPGVTGWKAPQRFYFAKIQFYEWNSSQCYKTLFSGNLDLPKIKKLKKFFRMSEPEQKREKYYF